MTPRKPAAFVLVAIVCAAGSVSFLSAVRPSKVAATTGTTESALLTPLWSPRRVPSLLLRAVESAARKKARDVLTVKLTSIVAPVDACVAVDSSAGELARVGNTGGLAPASTLKLLTAVTAIDRLGPDHRFTTRALTDAQGNLLIVGGGDPRLTTPDEITKERAQPRLRDAPFTSLGDLADAIVAAGVHSVSGALVVDDQLHDTLRFLPAWKPVYAQEGDIGSLGALTVNGGFAGGANAVPAADPALTTGRELATLLQARGVTIAGGVRRAATGSDAHEIAHIDSAPLSAIVGEMLTNSNNYTAEELLRDIAVTPDGNAPATTEAGTLIVRKEMRDLGVPTDGLVIHDGSGLAPDDRVSSATLVRLIELSDQPKFAAVDKGLAIAGLTGTLARRFVGDSLAGRLRAKTGSISGVVGLVGVIDRPDDLRFAFLANGNFSADAGAALQSEVAVAIGSTPDVRIPPDLIPPP